MLLEGFFYGLKEPPLCLLETPFCCLPNLPLSEVAQTDEIKGVAKLT